VLESSGVYCSNEQVTHIRIPELDIVKEW
jgi:hypothetical protein